MEYALVVLGFVKAVMVADADFISAKGADAASLYGYPSGTWVQTSEKVGVGFAYRDSTFFPRKRGMSVSGTSAATSVSAGQTLTVNVHGDGAQDITLAANTTGREICEDIQTKVRALTPNSGGHASAFSGFACIWDSVAEKYVLMLPNYGLDSTLVVSGGTAAEALKLGTANGGTETAGDGE